MGEIKLIECWKQALEPEFQKDYMQSLRAFLREELSAGKRIFPKGSEYFAALDTTPLEKVKVVILGQDPYHGPGQVQEVDHAGVNGGEFCRRLYP